MFFKHYPMEIVLQRYSFHVAPSRLKEKKFFIQVLCARSSKNFFPFDRPDFSYLFGLAWTEETLSMLISDLDDLDECQI